MAKLSNDPAGLELEDFVGAHLAARGVFVETGVTNRDPEDILELDIVWTDYDQPDLVRHPIEVKSGNWSLGDLFKYYGWTRYLDMDPGWYLCRRLPGRVDRDTLDRLSDRMGICLIHVDNVGDVDQQFEGLGLRAPPEASLPSLWRFSFWVQRRLLRSLGPAITENVCPESARAAKDYQKLINDAVFFEPDVRARVGSLLKAHFGHPRLAKSAASELAGSGPEFDAPPDTREFRDALFEGKHFPVQACLHLAQRGRLSVLKAAVDYIIARDSGALSENILRIFDIEIDVGEADLHESFRETVRTLEECPNFRRYPIFWQTFLFGWGGFLLLDRKAEEYEALSTQTRLPVEEIDTALAIWDQLFPVSGGWFVQPVNDSRYQIKLMPSVFRGIGAFSRLGRAGVEEYNELQFGDQTGKRLAGDHNSVARLLDGGDKELVR